MTPQRSDLQLAPFLDAGNAIPARADRTDCHISSAAEILGQRRTVHDYLELWNWDGTLEHIHHALYVAVRVEKGREAALADNNTDCYPVPLSADTLRLGTVYADPYGHIHALGKFTLMSKMAMKVWRASGLATRCAQPHAGVKLKEPAAGDAGSGRAHRADALSPAGPRARAARNADVDLFLF